MTVEIFDVVHGESRLAETGAERKPGTLAIFVGFKNGMRQDITGRSARIMTPVEKQRAVHRFSF